MLYTADFSVFCRAFSRALFASVVLIFCGIFTAGAYTVTYNCGFYNTGTTPPSSMTATANISFTPATNTCVAPSGAAFTGWVVSGTGDVKREGESFVWNYDEDKTFTAIWNCYWNSDETECVPGYTISLTKIGCSGALWSPPVPDKIYTIQGRGVYIGPERMESQLMEYRRSNDPNHPGKNPIKNPSLRFEYDLDVTSYVPTNPVTGRSYDPEQPSTVTQYYTFYFSNPPYFDTGGYITQNAGLANINQDKTISPGGGGGCGSQMPRESGIAGYTISWYDTNGNEIKQKPCSGDCSAPRTGTLYARWSANSYVIEYNLNGGEWGTGAKHPNSATYDTEFEVSNPINNNGYIFAGWNISNLNNVTHYYSESPIFVNNVYQSGTTQTSSGNSISGTKAMYFMNLRSVNSTADADVVFTATWECDTAKGYHWDTESETCSNVYAITYHNVDSDWISGQPVSYTYGNATQIGTPGKTGYVFLGWCVNDENCENYANNVNYTIPATSNSDIDLYAMWDCDAGYKWKNGECVQTFILTYDCGVASGGTWPDSQGPYPENELVTLLETPGAKCNASGIHRTFTEWTCDNATPDNKNQFNMPASLVKCTAQWDCDNANNYWWDSVNNECALGYEIDLTQSSVQWDVAPVPDKLYTIKNVGVYLDKNRTQRMTTSTNGIRVPAVNDFVVTYDTNAPNNPVTGKQYQSSSVENQNLAIGYDGSGIKEVWINSNGFITENGLGRALALSNNESWPVLGYTWESANVRDAPTLENDSYTFDGWYDNPSGYGEAISQLSYDSHPETLYAKWSGYNHNIQYYSFYCKDWVVVDSGNTWFDVDEEIFVEHPTLEGHIFQGWNITDMDSSEHYYSNSPIFVNGVYQSDTTNTTTSTSLNNILETHFMNLRTSSGTVTFTANWECDVANHWHPTSENEPKDGDGPCTPCTNRYRIKYVVQNLPAPYNDIYNDLNNSYQYAAVGDTNVALSDGPNVSVPTGYRYAPWNCVKDVDNSPVPTDDNKILEMPPSAVTCTATWACDTNYHLDTNGKCVISAVNLNWVVYGEQYNQNQASCIYGNGTINGITHQEIPGYTFTGWKVTNWE